MAKKTDFETADKEVEFWESHSSAEYWNEMEKVEFEVDLHRNLLHPGLIVITDKPGKCPRCQQALDETAIQYVTWHNGHLVFIRDVPVLHCRMNKHEYMLEKTLDKIELLLQLEKAQQIQPMETIHVPVFNLKMAG